MAVNRAVVCGFERVTSRLRDSWQIDVRELEGWRTYGRGPLVRPLGKVNHHTVGALKGGRYASLNTCVKGRPDVSGPLCNWYCPRGPGRELWVIAAGVANHAGKGSARTELVGSSRLIGLEAENDGVGEPWHVDAIYSTLALDIELAREFGYPPENIIEHREWAPGRKIDRTGIDPDHWRNRVATGLMNPPVTVPSPGAPMPTLRNGSTGTSVRYMQQLLIAKGHDLSQEGGIDGMFGEGTEQELKAFQAHRGLTCDGVCGPATWAALTT